jgi:hypothetical protein
MVHLQSIETTRVALETLMCMYRTPLVCCVPGGYSTRKVARKTRAGDVKQGSHQPHVKVGDGGSRHEPKSAADPAVQHSAVRSNGE